MPLSRRFLAELIGTFWLVLGGCGSAVLAAGAPDVGIGWVGVSLAFGLTVLTMAYAFGDVSGCHLNPAVTIGMVAGGRFKSKDVGPYIAAQLLGGFLGAAAVYLIASGRSDFRLGDGLAANGFGEHSPGGYSLGAAFVCEAVMTFMFLIVILLSTDERAPKGFAPIAIGLALTLIHLVSIPVTNTSVNPARSTGPAILVGGWALGQLWLFWIAPVAGAVAAGYVYRAFVSQKPPWEGEKRRSSTETRMKVEV